MYVEKTHLILLRRPLWRLGQRVVVVVAATAAAAVVVVDGGSGDDCGGNGGDAVVVDDVDGGGGGEVGQEGHVDSAMALNWKRRDKKKVYNLFGSHHKLLFFSAQPSKKKPG